MQTDELRPGLTAAGRFAFRGTAMITASELERELSTLHGMIRNFAPAHASNPERFHEEKSELVAFVQKLRDRQAGRAPASERSFTTPASDTGIKSVRMGQRSVPVHRKTAPRFSI